MKPRVLLLIVTVLLVFFGINAYIGWNGAVWWSMAFPELSPLWFWSLYVLAAGSYLAAMVLRRLLPYSLFVWLKRIGSYGMAIQFYALLLVPLADLTVLLLRLGGMEGNKPVLAAGWTAVAAIVLLLAWGSWNAWKTVIRRYELTVEKQAGGDMRELRIAAASDLHLGTVVGKVRLRQLANLLSRLKPDLILLAGDVLDDSIEPFIRENMAAVLEDFEAPMGVYACLGNHEYIGGHVEDYVGQMKSAGIEVLADRTVLVADSFYVAGRKDKAAERFTREGRLTLEELLKGVDKTKPVILLDHQPYGLGDAAEAGVDLMVSGHTHRGQMAPNHWITRRLFELDWGYLRKGAMHALVSSGFGFWGPPVRIGSRSEILDIRVRFTE